MFRNPLARRIAFRYVMEHGERVDPLNSVKMVRATALCPVADVIVEKLPDDAAVLPQGLDQIAVPVLLL
jgi:hypothetical protein